MRADDVPSAATGRNWKIVEVGGRPWRLGSDSNWLPKRLLVVGFPILYAARYPVRYPVPPLDVYGYRISQPG
jgi:hypothetical protein